MTPMFESPVRNSLACLAVLFCLTTSAAHVFAQKTETVLSKRPPVLKIYDPVKDEATVTSLLLDPNATAVYLMDRDSLPPPSMQLNSVEYTHAGIGPARPQIVTFVIAPLDKQKTAPAFSVAVDGTVIHEGEATLSELCCVQIGGRTEKTQRITVAVPTEIFERMAQAKKVELKLKSKSGNHSIKLKDYQRKTLAAVASTMK